MTIIPFLSAQGVLSYSITDTSHHNTIIIDPSVEMVQTILKKHATHTIKAVFLTHTHADFISSHAILSKIIPECRIYVHENTMGHSYTDLIRDGETISFSDIQVHALYTPGHTQDSVCYDVSDSHNEHVIFTGDTLLIGGTGRTDFQGGSSNALYESLTRILSYPDSTILYPNHNYNGQSKTMLGVEKLTNARLKLVHEGQKDAFIQLLDAHKPPLPDLFNQSLAYNMK